MELQELHDKLISEGCNRFYIEGIGGPISDDVQCLGMIKGEWAVFYTERNQKSSPIFRTSSKNEAIEYYYHFIKKMDHWHLIAFTRSSEAAQERKITLETTGIKVIQNDIPHYMTTGDCVYRIFVTNEDIFKAEKLFDKIPFRDSDL